MESEAWISASIRCFKVKGEGIFEKALRVYVNFNTNTLGIKRAADEAEIRRPF